MSREGLIRVLVNWLNSRGAVQEPWREYSREANSLLVFQVLFNWISGLIALLLVAGVLVPLFMMLAADRLIASYSGAIVASVVLLIIFVTVCGFIKMILSHFIVPLMYQRRLAVLDGFRAFAPVYRA